MELGDRISFIGLECSVDHIYGYYLSGDDHPALCREFNRFVPFERDQFEEVFGVKACRLNCGFPEFESLKDLETLVNRVEAVYKGEYSWTSTRDDIERAKLGITHKQGG